MRLAWKLPRICWVGLAVGFLGCAPTIRPQITRLSSPSGEKVCITPPARSATVQAEDQSNLAPAVVMEAWSYQLGRLGCLVQSDPTPLDKPPTFNQAAALAREQKFQGVWVGRIDAWHQGALFGRPTEVRIALDLIDSSGLPVLQIRHGKTGAQEDPADIAREVIAEVGSAIREQLEGLVCPKPGLH